MDLRFDPSRRAGRGGVTGGEAGRPWGDAFDQNNQKSRGASGLARRTKVGVGRVTRGGHGWLRGSGFGRHPTFLEQIACRVGTDATASPIPSHPEEIRAESFGSG